MIAQRPTAVSRVEQGLTLLEMLIVLVVIAVAAGATTLSLAPRRGNATEAEARLLAEAIQAGVDRGIATGAREALVADDTGYAVGSGGRHVLPSGTTLGGMTGPLSLAFDGGRPFDLVIVRGDDRWRVSFDGLRAAATVAAP